VGAAPATGFLTEPPIPTQDGYIEADETGTTAIPGLFADHRLTVAVPLFLTGLLSADHRIHTARVLSRV
jgi:hypothetical protein